MATIFHFQGGPRDGERLSTADGNPLEVREAVCIEIMTEGGKVGSEFWGFGLGDYIRAANDEERRALKPSAYYVASTETVNGDLAATLKPVERMVGR